jgi:hypothetical protein
MGMKQSSYIMSWFFSEAVTGLTVAAITTIICIFGKNITYANIGPFILILFLFIIGIVTMGLFISTFFSKPRVAVIIGDI